MRGARLHNRTAATATAAIAASAAVLLWLAAPAAAQNAQPPKSGGGKAAAAPATAAAPAATYAQRYAQVCAACHGANGRSDLPNTPALAGQHSFYAITQLFMFREGRRANEAMTAIAKDMKDADLRGFSEYIATLPPVPAPPPATAPDAARMSKGQALAREHKCVFCHGDDFSGGQQVPRIGGQREDYLRMTLREFRAGKRPGYTMAMGEAVSRIPEEDLDTLAYYLAHFNPSAPAKTAPPK